MVFDNRNTPYIPAEIQQALEKHWQQQKIGQEHQELKNELEQQKATIASLSNLKQEHANCQTTIQSLKDQNQTLQNQLNQLLGISSETTETQMEAKVQQPNLPPK